MTFRKTFMVAIISSISMGMAGCYSPEKGSESTPSLPEIPIEIPEQPEVPDGDPEFPDEPSDPDEPIDPTPEATWYKPQPMTTWNLQYQGEPADVPVEFYVVDMFDTSEEEISLLKAGGKKVGCYISVGTLESWRPDFSDFSEADIGNPLPWEGEEYININSQEVQNIMASRIQLAATKGCDAVEFSSSDTYTADTGFAITDQDQVNYNIFLAETAHNNDLGAGLKNTLLLVDQLVEHYDFVINTSCFTYSECSYLDPFIEANKAVFNIQNEQVYKDDAAERESLCSESVNKMFSTIFLEWSFSGSYREACLGSDSSDPTPSPDPEPENPESPENPNEPESGNSWFQPSPMATWDIQYTGAMEDRPVEVQLVDMFDTSVSRIESLQAGGAKVICYISAGSSEDWRPDVDQFEPGDLGNDMNWPGETWLNIKSDNVRSIMQSRVQLAKNKKCDGVDFDNIDGYVNDTGFNFTEAEQIDYIVYLSGLLHSQDMAAGLKNVPQLINKLEQHFDFAISESCATYNECDYFQPFIDSNKAVFHIQYEEIYKTDSLERDRLCQDSVNRMFSTLILDYALDNSYRDSCLAI